MESNIQTHRKKSDKSSGADGCIGTNQSRAGYIESPKSTALGNGRYCSTSNRLNKLLFLNTRASLTEPGQLADTNWNRILESQTAVTLIV